jgi:outer membrane protein assembly factor BamB
LFAALAADWPQWRGPDRDDLSKETGLLRSWPSRGPRLLWTFADAGEAFSAPAIVGKHLYCMGADARNDCVYAVNLDTQKKVWTARIAPRFVNGWGDGPRGTPTVDGASLYAISGDGVLACLETATGKKRWSVDLKRDLGGEMMSSWGYSESPLVDGNQVACTPGGARGALAALDKQTGKVLWRSTEFKDQAAYSSLVAANIGGTRQYVQMTGNSVAGIRASDGKMLWRIARESPTAAIPTPVIAGSSVYFTSGYNTGCMLVDLAADGKGVSAKTAYTNRNMVNQHGGVVLVGEHLYGYCDRNGWVCQELRSGKVKWKSNKLGKGSVTYADGCLYCYAEDDGTVVLAEASPRAWTEKGRFKIPRESRLPRKQGRIWTHPVVSNGRLYLRDIDLIFCFDVAGATSQ